jgi:transcriptional regulator with XRE-family HTH domain
MDASILYREVGAVIRRRRRALDLTQAKLATRLGISRGALANIETGRQNLLLHQLYRFAAALDMNVHDLLPVLKDMNLRDLLPLAKEEPNLSRSKGLPMPKGLTPDQKAQVARVFNPARRTTTTEGE